MRSLSPSPLKTERSLSPSPVKELTDEQKYLIIQQALIWKRQQKE
jgi:hypothetical protein